jgi:hypothetical protein
MHSALYAIGCCFDVDFLPLIIVDSLINIVVNIYLRNYYDNVILDQLSLQMPNEFLIRANLVQELQPKKEKKRKKKISNNVKHNDKYLK